MPLSPPGHAAPRRALSCALVAVSLMAGGVTAANAQLAQPMITTAAAAPLSAAKPFTPVVPSSVSPFAAMSASARALRDSLVALARAQIGRRYVRGGRTPERGFDCSGLVQYITAALHFDVPRTARQQAGVGLAVARDTSRLLPGDLLTFGKGKRGASHIGIYVGDGLFVHASTKAGRVIESRLDRPLYRGVKPWLGVRRIIAADDDTAATRATRGAN